MHPYPTLPHQSQPDPKLALPQPTESHRIITHPTSHKLFNLIHTGKELVESPEWSEHERNGGSMADHEFYSSRHLYYRRPNIITLPTKRECGVIPRDRQTGQI